MSGYTSLDTLILGCESEQLHLSGAIQSFGALVVIESATMTITQASANLQDLVGVGPDQVLGKAASTFKWLACDRLKALPDPVGSRLILTTRQDCTEPVHGIAIRGNGAILVEIEPFRAVTEPLPIQQLQLPLLTVPYDDDEVAQHHEMLVQALRAITGFDRIMIYRFQEDWSGEVIAEVCAPALGSYLGLRFPASDIPAVARNLYLLNPIRLIPDTKAPAVPVLGLEPNPPDLTWSDLRSVSPVHLEYLDHMGVRASFSVPIRIRGRLWGLVACHHLSPNLLTQEQRAGCVSLVNAYSLGMTSHFASCRIQSLDSMDRRINKILENLAKYENPLDGIEQMHNLLMESMNAQGFAMAIGDDVVIVGQAPDLAGMGIIDDWFINRCADMVVVTDHFEDLFHDPSLALSVVSGMVAVKARSARSGWVRFYWFRPAQLQEVAWAGNPNKPGIENAGVLMLSPRRSFEKWIEVKSGYSHPWNNEERMTAAKFRTTLLQWL